jgi:hypothetical protein
MLDETSGSTVSIAVHKTGPASDWIGHNLLLRVRRFWLRPSTEAILRGQKQLSNDASCTTTSGSLVRFAVAAPATQQSSPKHHRDPATYKDVLKICCDSVLSASFDPLSISVAGSIPQRFCPPKFLSGDNDNESGGNSQNDAALMGSSNEVSNDIETHHHHHFRIFPFHKKFPSLFRWPFNPMSESDTKQILRQTVGERGLLSLKDRPSIVPEIIFEKTSSQTDHLPFSISGNLTLAGRTNQISCGVFLTPTHQNLPNSSNSENDDSPSPLQVVFQCPIDTEKFGIPRAGVLGLLKTENEVLVEIAVPLEKLNL